MNIKSKKKLFTMTSIIAIILILIVGIILFFIFRNKDESVSAGTVHNQIDTTKIEEDRKIEEAEAIKKEKRLQLQEWNLLLVNSEHKLPDDYDVELSNVDSDRKFDARAIKYLTQMIEDARKAGYLNIWAQSTYRTIKEQTKIYNNKVNQFKGMGYSTQKAEELTQEYVNKPGYSEHNLALAVDFNMVETSFEEAKVFGWLKEHGYEYGFILRYPKNKEEITKVSYEPWHWRYVGKKHAEIIKQNNWCLEEYIEYLSE